MSLKDVIDRFALVSGLEQEEISKWIFVIVDCIKYFESKLQKRYYTDEEKMRLSHSCAVYAYYKYSLFNYAQVASKFKVGDIEITNSENLTDKAHALWQNEKGEIADIIDFDGFYFSRVRA